MAAFAIPLIMGGLGALGGIFGNRPKQTTQTQDMTTSGKESQTGSATGTSEMNPVLSALQQTSQDTFLRSLLDRIRSQTDLRGYQAGGIQDINQGYNVKTQALQNMLAARGLSFSPAASTAQMGLESGRLGDITKFNEQMPLIQRQMGIEDINNLIQGFLATPKGSRTTSAQDYTTNRDYTSQSHGTMVGTQPGDMMGGLFQGLGGAISPLLGRVWANKYPVTGGGNG